MTDPRSRKSASWWIPAAVGALAALLRLPWLWRLGLRGDEDISTLAARGIVAGGWPQLPSGNAYWRAPLFHYAIAPLVATGIDWAPRLLSVLASALTAVLVVRLGRRWVGDHAALVGGLLFAVSLVEIDFARRARMYALYQLMALAVFMALYLLWVKSRPLWVYLGAGAIGVAMMLHELGSTLAVLFLLVAVRGRSLGLRLAAVLIIPLFAFLSRIQNLCSYWLHVGGRQPVPEVLAPVPGTPVAAEVFLGQQRLALGAETLGVIPFGVFIVALFAVGAALAWRATGDMPVLQRLAAAAGLGAVTGLAAAHQIGLALAFLVLLVLQLPELYPSPRARRALLLAAGIMAMVAGGWILLTVAQGHPPKDIAFGLFGRLLGRFVRNLVLWPPAVTLAAVAGSALILHRCWKGRAADGERFILLAVVALTAGRSVLASRSNLRYLADVWPLWELLAGVAVVAVFTALPRRLPGRLTPPLAATAMASIFLLTPGTNPVKTLSHLARGHGEGRASGFAQADMFVPDIRSAAGWLLERRQPGDRIVATDWLTTYCYTGQVDGWIRTRGHGKQSTIIDGVARETYLGAEVLKDIPDIVAFSRAGPTWIVLGGLEMEDPRKLSPTVKEWLLEHDPAFVSDDGRTRIIRLETTLPGTS